MVAKNIWPPSSTGRGSRLKIARFTFTTIVNHRAKGRPARENSKKLLMIPMGPDMCDALISERGFTSALRLRMVMLTASVICRKGLGWVKRIPLLKACKPMSAPSLAPGARSKVRV